MSDCSICYVAIRVCEEMSLEQIYIPLVGMTIRYLDAYDRGVVGFTVERNLFISSRYNPAGDLRSGTQVQVREWLRSGGH